MKTIEDYLREDQRDVRAVVRSNAIVRETILRESEHSVITILPSSYSDRVSLYEYTREGMTSIEGIPVSALREALAEL